MFRAIFMVLAVSITTMANEPNIKIECPYDDFGEEEIFFELKDGRVLGELISPYLVYEVKVDTPKVDIQYKNNGTLWTFHIEGTNSVDNEFIGFSFEADDFGEGIGNTVSKTIGNRVFICHQAF